jgi:hypothetical protein
MCLSISEGVSATLLETGSLAMGTLLVTVFGLVTIAGSAKTSIFTDLTLRFEKALAPSSLRYPEHG